MNSGEFRTLKINLAIGFIPKNHGKAEMMLYLGYFDLQPILKFICQYACQPAVRPGCSRCRAKFHTIMVMAADL